MYDLLLHFAYFGFEKKRTEIISKQTRCISLGKFCIKILSKKAIK